MFTKCLQNKCLVNTTPHLSLDGDGICDDEADYRRQGDATYKKDMRYCKAHILECENIARETGSNQSGDLYCAPGLNMSASSFRPFLSETTSPSTNSASPHFETKILSEASGMSAQETQFSGQLPIQGSNLEQAGVTLKKSRDRSRVIGEQENMKNSFVTSHPSASCETCVSVSPPHLTRERSVGSSSISKSGHDSVALTPARSADGDSSRVFTPDAASGKGICTRAGVAGRSAYTSQIPDYLRRLKPDSRVSQGSTLGSDDNTLITFDEQHNNNNCSLVSTSNELSQSCELHGGRSDIVSSTRRDSQDKGGNIWNQCNVDLLDEDRSRSCHTRQVHDSQAGQPVIFQKDQRRKSTGQCAIEEVKYNRKLSDSDPVRGGQRHLLLHKPGNYLQGGQPLISKSQTVTSSAGAALKSSSRHALQRQSSNSRTSLRQSHSLPAIVHGESFRYSLPLLRADTNDGLNRIEDSSTNTKQGHLYTKLKSLECRVFQPGLPGESPSKSGATCSSWTSAAPECVHPLIQHSAITDSSNSADAGFSEELALGDSFMRFHGSNDHLYSHLGSSFPNNYSSSVRRSKISRFFHQRLGSSSDVSLRKCSSCSNVDFTHSLQSTSSRGAKEDNHDELQSENQLYTATPGRTCVARCPETEYISESLISILPDCVSLDQNVNTLAGPDQAGNNGNQRSVLFPKDDQQKYICQDNNHNENNLFTRLGRVDRRDQAYSRTNSTDTALYNSTSTPCMAQVHTEAGKSLTAPAIRITASAFSGDTSSGSSADNIHQPALSASSPSPTPAAEIYSAASQKRRVSFINGLRRLSREKTAFLRVEQPCSIPPRTQSSVSQCVEKQDESDTVKVGRRFGRDNKRRLKVEFAVMDTDSEKMTPNKGTTSLSGGLISIKDDVENDVAMLGGGGGRFRHPRVSLLGKPLNYRAHRRDVSYRRLQARIYNFLERPKSWQSWIYHLTMFLFVLLCLTMGVVSSITEFEKLLLQYAVYLEIVMLLWIVVELGLRVWSAGCRSRYQGQSGRLRFLRRPLCIIDTILVLASVCSLIVGSTQEHFSQAVLSGLRFFQILRMVRMDRKGGTWKLLGSVVWAHRQELVTTLYIGLLGLVFSSYFVYLAEKDEPKLENGLKGQYNHTEYKPKFSNFADAIWWGVVTLCTVGYGDVVPATWGGKVIASFSAILGISFFALPAGILGSGFALKVQQQQRQKHLNRRRIPAANLIQCLWRCYAADELSMSTATWKPHLIPCPSPPSERTFKNNTSFVSRFSTRRRDRSSATGSFSRDGLQAQSPMSSRHHCRRAAISTSEEEVTNVIDRSHLSLATGATEQKYHLDTTPFRKENSVTSIGKESEEEDLSPRLTQLTDQHKRIIRVVRKIRYFVARRKFREALRPYDVKDVIEQYSAGHIDMLARIKNLQGRLDQILGRQGSKSKDVYESKICLASRIVKVERQVEDIETKLDMLLDMYKEDRKLILQQLNITQKGAIQGDPSQPPPPPPAPSSQFKPRPILIDKQFTSEPATPTGVGFASSPRGRLHGIKPVIQRNLSDLSQRIKKRVTYRGLYLQDPPSRAQSAANFASIQPSNFPATTTMTTATSPDEISSTTMSENTRDESSENIISLNDTDLPLNLDIKMITGDSRQETSPSAQTGSSDSGASLLNTEETYFFSNSSFCPSLKSIQQMAMSSSPVNSPLMRVKLSTLNEQLSLESDNSQSCSSSSPPTPPTNQTAADISRNTPPGSAQQSPLIPRQKHLSGTDNSSQCQTSSPLSSRRPHKPILRLPSALASTVSSAEGFSATNSESPRNATLSPNDVNSTHDVLFPTEDTSKLCNMEDDSVEFLGSTNPTCRTSEL